MKDNGPDGDKERKEALEEKLLAQNKTEKCKHCDSFKRVAMACPECQSERWV